MPKRYPPEDPREWLNRAQSSLIWTIRTVLLVGLITSACQGGTPLPASVPVPAETRTSPVPKEPAPSAAKGRCGDGVCDGPENAQNCPQDCAPTPPPTAVATPVPSPAAVGAPDVTYVTNPTSGARLFVQVIKPPSATAGQRYPALVMVPGGALSGQEAFLKGAKGPSVADDLAAGGFLIIVFDPDGRGSSQGLEDDDGFIHQDGLKAVVDYVASRPDVNPATIGLVSYSYGVTMATGALARYPDLPIAFYIDWEGPIDRNDTGGCDQDKTGHLQFKHSCDEEDFWVEREAIKFIGDVRVPYQRIQFRVDHAQPDNLHALRIVNKAVESGVPWVRLNDGPVNATYDLANPPQFPEKAPGERERLVVRYAQELIGTRVSSAVGDYQGKLFVSFIVHNEEDTVRGKPKPTEPDYDGNEALLLHYTRAMRELGKVCQKHGVRMNFGSDWTFIQGVINYDPAFFQDLVAMGHEIDAHGHETTVKYRELKEMLESTGVPVTTVASGFDEATIYEHMAYFDAIYPEFDILWGAAVPGHGAGEELTGYVWRPARDNWFRHDPNGRYIYIGHNLQLNSIESIKEALNNLYPNRINTYSLIAITRVFKADPGTPGVPEEWTAPLNDRYHWRNQLQFYDDLLTQIDAYVASGKVEYRSLTEVKETFIHNEDALDFNFDLEDIPRSSKPLHF